MGESVENVTLPFDDGGEDKPDSPPPTDSALALAPGDTPAVRDADITARLADYTQSWGITIPVDFTPVTKAQVAYRRELCGAITLTGADGMGDRSWPSGLIPARGDVTALKSSSVRRWGVVLLLFFLALQ
jgi:hypothetical protein